MLNKQLNKSLRSLFALLVLVTGLGLGSVMSAIPVQASDQQSSQQQATAQTSEADLWRAVKAGDAGYTTAKGIETGVLINVVGKQGKELRNEYLTPLMALAVDSAFGACF